MSTFTRENMGAYCPNCGQKGYPRVIRRPPEAHETPGMKVEWVSPCCHEPVTDEAPILICPIDGCAQEMHRIDEEWCECDRHGQRLIKDILFGEG